MALFRQLFSTQLVKHRHFLSELLGGGETFRHKHVLANEQQIGDDHGYWSEKCLEIIGQLRSTSIPRIHRNENTDGRDKSHVDTQQINLLLACEQTVLDGFNLGGNDTKHFDINSVELIEASPETSLDKSGEDGSDSHGIHSLTTVSDDTSDSKRFGQILDGLRFTCTSWPGG
jgi:hypothetical protein